MVNEVLNSYGLNVEHLGRLIKDVPNEDFVRQPGSLTNHPAWIVGHLIFSCQALGGELALEPWLPSVWESKFGTGSIPTSDLSAYPSKAELLSYSVIGSPNHPVTYVSWADAIRFANWIHNGQPTGAQSASTTEDGAYTLNGATSDAALSTVSRNGNAKWFIPTENEWYKAAYYQPAALGGDSDNYWHWPMGTNNSPYSDQPPGGTPDNTRVGNFPQNDFVANGYDDEYAVTGAGYSSSENYLTDVGAYTLSSGFYGTFDQGGNVWEWNEALIEGSFRGLRGGSWNINSFGMIPSHRSHFYGHLYHDADAGFRLASIPNPVPEPSTLLLAITAHATLLTVRRKLVPHNRV